MLLLLFYQTMVSSAARELYDNIVGSGVDRLLKIITRGLYDRSWKTRDPKQTAIAIHGLLMGEVIKVIIKPPGKTLAAQIRRTQNSINLLLGK